MEIEELLTRIRETDPKWGTEVAICVCRWLEESFPEAEICYLVLPRGDRAERLRILERIVAWERDGDACAETDMPFEKWGRITKV